MNGQTISVAEAKKNFSELLGKVAYGKERITITKKGRPMACLVPAEQSNRVEPVQLHVLGRVPFEDLADIEGDHDRMEIRRHEHLDLRHGL